MRAFPLRAISAFGALAAGAACASAQQPPLKTVVDTADIKPLDTTPWVPGPGHVFTLQQGPDFTPFGLGLFHRLADARPGENVIVSPLSAGLALGMLANGATDETLAGIQRTLATGLTQEVLNAASADLVAALRTEDVELAIANSLWAREGVPFLDSFMAQNRRSFRAEVTSLDFTSPDAARRINEWASRNTNGRITEMVRAPLDADLILYLMNAVYFKGRWQDEFQASATRPRTFHAPRGDVQRPMMERTGSYGVLQGDGFEAVRMPYRGGRFALYVLLPDAGQSLAQLRGRMTAQAWARWMGDFVMQEVRLTLPKFRMELESRLNDPLQAMGMGDAFSASRARFGAMLPAEYLARQNAYVSEAKQKVFVEVNEEGTEAAAVTGIGMRTTSMPAPPRAFVVDRPFVLAIRDDQTGALLFIGHVNDPVTQ
jgi:serine protease inhibitor